MMNRSGRRQINRLTLVELCAVIGIIAVSRNLRWTSASLLY